MWRPRSFLHHSPLLSMEINDLQQSCRVCWPFRSMVIKASTGHLSRTQ